MDDYVGVFRKATSVYGLEKNKDAWIFELNKSIEEKDFKFWEKDKCNWKRFSSRKAAISDLVRRGILKNILPKSWFLRDVNDMIDKKREEGHKVFADYDEFFDVKDKSLMKYLKIILLGELYW